MTFARVRALIFVAVLFVTAGVVVLMAVNKDTQTRPRAATDCPPGLVPANVAPPEVGDVKLNIYNGTKKVGLAEQIRDEFENRGFKVQKIGTAAGNKVYDEVAVIQFGPRAVAAAWLVRAHFLLVDEDPMEFDLKRENDVVDVIVGTRFQKLATTTEVNQSIAALGAPQLPPGTCAM
jgi:hypothetical protein